MKYLPIVVIAGSALTGYVTLQGEVKYLRETVSRIEAQHDKDMQDYLGWNKSISERLRDVERGR